MKKATMAVLLACITLSVGACGSAGSRPGPSEEAAQKPDAALMESGNAPAAQPSEGEAAGEAKPSGREKDAAQPQYEIGDIVFADGSVGKAASVTAIHRDNEPVAVIAGFREDGTAFGVGVHRSDGPLQWAPEDSAGYATGFADTVCTQVDGGAFAGDLDGSDNWDVICAQDREDTGEASEKYPAFHFVNTYADTYGLTGDMALGWYMPGIAELCSIYQNREAINNSLQRIYGLDQQAAMNGLETNWYWSSSQAGVQDDYAWFVHFFNGYAGECPKNFTNVHALAIRKF